MNTLYSRGNDMDDDPEVDERNREISLGTSFIVGIFFALILICAIFFAFGYSLGRRSVLPASGVPAPATSTSAAKPASGIPETQGSANTNTTDEENSSAAKESPIAAAATVAIKPTPSSRPVAQSPTMPGAAGSVVQVAAVSHQGDANMLMAALKRKGYNAAIRQVPQDKLLHVQIGPFATKKEAEAMRQRLISDGYNAIVK